MANKKTRIEYGAGPRVDLLPEAQRAERAHKAALPRMLMAVVLSAVVAGAIWLAGSAPVLLANQQLALAEAESTELLTQISQYAEEQTMIGAVTSLTQERDKLAVTEVLFIDLLDEANRVLPDDVELVQFTGELVSADGSSAPTERGGLDLNPLCVPDVATITLKFHGENLDPIPNYVSKLENMTGFKCIVATKIEVEQDGEPQNVTVQIALTEEALAGRFVEATE